MTFKCTLNMNHIVCFISDDGTRNVDDDEVLNTSDTADQQTGDCIAQSYTLIYLFYVNCATIVGTSECMMQYC